jgi:hypothetical protein
MGQWCASQIDVASFVFPCIAVSKTCGRSDKLALNTAALGEAKFFSKMRLTAGK